MLDHTSACCSDSLSLVVHKHTLQWTYRNNTNDSIDNIDNRVGNKAAKYKVGKVKVKVPYPMLGVGGVLISLS